MKKNIVKPLYSFGTAVLAFGTLATASMPIVSATTVSSSQEAAVSALCQILLMDGKYVVY